ncbi:MAG: hypothetical protein CMI54_06440 [Parcubacteria group bacterium]|nr:hypothetical protein [Parcubacteria group bacterium]|tara:strand:- start:382 stop:819 length:438 start_codon:yes stop_codon:yes gene_type:complete
MSKELTKDQYWELFEKLPQEIKTLILSEQTAKDIFNICDRNNVDMENVSQVADYTGRVLLGALKPEELQGVLEKVVFLQKDQAKKVAEEIHRFIFFPVKRQLEGFHKTETAPSTKPSVKTAPPKIPAKRKPRTPPRKDDYREQVN